MKDIILDTLKYTAGSNFFECVKITGTQEETTIQATDGLPSIVLNAVTHKPVSELEGVFGLGNLSYLKGLTNWEPFRKQDSTVAVIRKDRNGEETPELIEYKSSDGASATYRLMHASAIPPMPAFKGTEWDIEFTPTKEKIEEFSQLAALHADMEEQFNVKTVGKDLVFYIGEEGAATHKAQFVFHHDLELDGNHEIKAGIKWPINQVLQTLRLSQSGDSVMKISKKGVICVSIDSGLAKYDFYILANQK